MLSNRITAKSLELNPANQARKRMVNESKDCHPAGCVRPPDRPPLPPPPPPPVVLGLLLPWTKPPAFADTLCLPSPAVWCSAISVGCVCGGCVEILRSSPSPSTTALRRPPQVQVPVCFHTPIVSRDVKNPELLTARTYRRHIPKCGLMHAPDTE